MKGKTRFSYVQMFETCMDQSKCEKPHTNSEINYHISLIFELKIRNLVTRQTSKKLVERMCYNPKAIEP